MGDNRYPGDTQFAGLVEAATAAADQEIHWSANAESTSSDVRPSYEAYETHAPTEEPYNTLPTGQYDDSIATKSTGPSTRKRKRDIDTLREDRVTVDGLQPSNYNAASSAPRPSVAATSAAAIFRQPSTTSKKYTRPPIGKLYSSLELSPESFVHLQTAAKEYMLDENHPERLDTIGQRGRGDTDLVRLKLWNFVKEFLDDLGNGQKFFGEHISAVEGQAPRTMIWPHDAERIIKACVPVLRRMVTNERQRRYAMQTRKISDDVLGHESGKERPVARSASANASAIPKLSRANILELEILDLLNDGCVPGGYEAADWYSAHSRHPSLQEGLSSSALDERDYRILVANIDGHCRIYHNCDVSQCKEECEAQAIERLLSWDSLYNTNVTTNVRERQSRLDGILRQVFGLVKSHLQSRPSEPDSEALPPSDGAAADPGRQDVIVSQDESIMTRTRLAKKADSRRASKRADKRSSEALVLHVNLVSIDGSDTSHSTLHSTKRLADPFFLPAVFVPNLQALQAEIQKHFGQTLQQLPSSDVSGASQSSKVNRENPELSVKVWLPDGLVRIRDDGEWMVALLSAELVEWMDKEVKILVEILT
jgi:hypothetical protein